MGSSPRPVRRERRDRIGGKAGEIWTEFRKTYYMSTLEFYTEKGEKIAFMIKV